MRKRVLRYMASALVAVLCLGLLQSLLMPKYMEGIKEGALISEYYEEERAAERKQHDVLFLGDCEVYENFIPQTLWDAYGIHSYIRGSAKQKIWQSYYLLEETLKYEKPKVVVLSTLAMKYGNPADEAYNRLTLDGMRWSRAKVESVQASMTKEESFLSYVFPILRYHERFDELTAEDFTYWGKRSLVSYNGYELQTGVKPVEEIPEAQQLGNYQFSSRAYDYLERITKLCAENEIALVLIKAPSLYPVWYEEWDTQMQDYAKRNNLRYYNLLEADIDIDYTTDTYDAGLHLNYEGARKLSLYFGKELQDTYGLTSRKQESKLAESWEREKARMETELAKEYAN